MASTQKNVRLNFRLTLGFCTSALRYCLAVDFSIAGEFPDRDAGMEYAQDPRRVELLAAVTKPLGSTGIAVQFDVGK